MPAEAETLRAEIERLRACLANTAAAVPVNWHLTTTEERVFRILLAVEIATRESIAEGAAVKCPRTQGVHICRMRRKLKPHRVEIETVQRKGWRLVGREAWRALLTPEAA